MRGNLEMPPAAEPEFSQAELATVTHGNLPTQKLASIIDNAEAQKDAPANSKRKIKNNKKGRCPENFNYDFKQKKQKLKYK